MYGKEGQDWDPGKGKPLPKNRNAGMRTNERTDKADKRIRERRNDVENKYDDDDRLTAGLDCSSR